MSVSYDDDFLNIYSFNSEFSIWNCQETMTELTDVSSTQSGWEDKNKESSIKTTKKRKEPFKEINTPNKKSKESNSSEIFSQMNSHEYNRNFDTQPLCSHIIYTEEQVKESIKKFKAVKWKNFEECTKEYDDFTPIEERCTIC